MKELLWKSGPASLRPVDAHVHIRGREALHDISSSGVAVVRDAGAKSGAGLLIGTQRRARSGVVCVSAGWALFKKGGYGAALGIPVEKADDLRNEIIRLKCAGAAVIKVIASGIVSLENKDAITPGGFDSEELAVVVREARDQGLHVMAHANGEEAIIACAQAGVRSIEHGFFMTARALDVMSHHHIFWVPTVGALARAAETAGVAGQMRDYVNECIHEHLGMIFLAHAAGVPLAIGTDAVLPDSRYREAYTAELAYFEQAGLSHDAIRSIACENGARLLDLEDQGHAARS